MFKTLFILLLIIFIVNSLEIFEFNNENNKYIKVESEKKINKFYWKTKYTSKNINKSNTDNKLNKLNRLCNYYPSIQPSIDPLNRPFEKNPEKI
jgi:hypothetical protein